MYINLYYIHILYTKYIFMMHCPFANSVLSTRKAYILKHTLKKNLNRYHNWKSK